MRIIIAFTLFMFALFAAHTLNTEKSMDGLPAVNGICQTEKSETQFLYHSTLVKNQDGISLTLFGNGYMTHYREMIFEMEIPAFLYNFGVIGFFLYCMPFLFIILSTSTAVFPLPCCCCN